MAKGIRMSAYGTKQTLMPTMRMSASGGKTDAEAAARFYAETFPGSAVRAVHRAPSDYPSGQGGRRVDGRIHSRRRPLHRPQRWSRRPDLEPSPLSIAFKNSDSAVHGSRAG